jgi:hypothetical protein
LEELIGLAESGGLGLEIAKKIYQKSLDKFDELCAPYATVIDIDKNKLPTVKEIESWDGASYANTLRHDAANLKYNPNFSQLLHVGYKIAALFGNEYLQALKENEKIIEKNVVDNLFNRHIKPLLLD